MHDTSDMINLGPAPAPPQWWVHDTEREFCIQDGVPLTAWTRLFGGDGDVWVTVYDRGVGGRLMRSKPLVYVSDALAAPAGGITIEQARELAQALLEAVEALEAEREEFILCHRDGGQPGDGVRL